MTRFDYQQVMSDCMELLLVFQDDKEIFDRYFSMINDFKEAYKIGYFEGWEYSKGVRLYELLDQAKHFMELSPRKSTWTDFLPTDRV